MRTYDDFLSEGGRIAVRNIVKWEMDATNPW